jgi:hypothetical protein
MARSSERTAASSCNPVFTEEYSDMQVDVKLNPAVFDSKQFSSLHWEK